MKTILEQTIADQVNELVPQIYEHARAEFRWADDYDVSRSNRCHALTLDLWSALDKQELPARRELHLGDYGMWHYVIAHTMPGTEPAADDLITDLNPWMGDLSFRNSGHLHAPRTEVLSRLEQTFLPMAVVDLRSMGTISLAHDVRTHPRQPLVLR